MKRQRPGIVSLAYGVGLLVAGTALRSDTIRLTAADAKRRRPARRGTRVARDAGEAGTVVVDHPRLECEAAARGGDEAEEARALPGGSRRATRSRSASTAPTAADRARRSRRRASGRSSPPSRCRSVNLPEERPDGHDLARGDLEVRVVEDRRAARPGDVFTNRSATPSTWVGVGPDSLQADEHGAAEPCRARTVTTMPCGRNDQPRGSCSSSTTSRRSPTCWRYLQRAGYDAVAATGRRRSS